MNIREINKPVNSKTLNETMAKKFGTKVNVESFTLEQLQDARNKMRTKQFDIETNESFSGLSQNRSYSKNKLFLDVLNAAISERSDIAEAQTAAQKAAFQKMLDKKKGAKPADTDDADKKPSDDKKPGDEDKEVDEAAKPDFADLDGDGDKKEPMKKAAKDAKKSNKPKKGVKPSFKKGVNPFEKKVDEGKAIIETYFASVLKEGAEDHAELVMAAKDMVDRVTGWMEDTAEMQTESMLELADAIRDEMGSEKSEAFTMALKPALEAMYGVMETTRVSLTTGVGMLTGEADEAPMMGADDELGMEPEMGMEPPVDGDIDDLGMDDLPDDEFGASGAADGGVEDAGRAKRESKVNRKKKVSENSRKLSNILSKKK